MGNTPWVEVGLQFRFPFQGAEWGGLWVNANLTFGAGDTSRPEDPLESFRFGPPRIPPFFADLDPSASETTNNPGLVIAEEGHDFLTVHWVSVSGLSSFDATNTFSVTFGANGDIRMAWQFIEQIGSRAVVGIAEGNGVVLPAPTDLSEIKKRSAIATTYEEFDGFFAPFDLRFDEMRFVGGK